MNVQELRTTLHEHAEQVDDIGAPARLAATHDRVAVVRRHRRAGVAAAAAAAVVAVVTAGTLTLLDDDQPVQPAGHTPARLAGFRISKTFNTSEGARFVYRRGVEGRRGQDRLVVELPASQQPYAIAWGVRSRGNNNTTITVDGSPAEAETAGELYRGSILAAGVPHQVVVDGTHDPREQLAIAVYRLAGRLPEGKGNGSTVFRHIADGNRLVGAGFGSLGQSHASFDVRITTLRQTFSAVCYGAPGEYHVVLRVNGHRVGGAGCSPLVDPDPASSSTTVGPRNTGLVPGETTQVTVALVDASGRPVRSRDVVIGGAVYEKQPGMTRLAGSPIPLVTQTGPGVVYRYERSAQSRPGEPTLTVHLPASDRPALLEVAAYHTEKTQVLVDGKVVTGTSGWPTTGSVPGVLAGGPHTVTVRVEKGLTPQSVLGIAVFRRGH